MNGYAPEFAFHNNFVECTVPCALTRRMRLLRYESSGAVLVATLNDEEPLIRGHAAWALGRIGTKGRCRRCGCGKRSS